MSTQAFARPSGSGHFAKTDRDPVRFILREPLYRHFPNSFDPTLRRETWQDNSSAANLAKGKARELRQRRPIIGAFSRSL